MRRDQDWKLLGLGIIGGYIGASILDHIGSRGFASEDEDKEDLEGCEEGMFYVDGLFVDSGSPSGGLIEGLDFPMISMNELYRDNNVVFRRDAVHIIPARDNIATGQEGCLSVPQFSRGLNMLGCCCGYGLRAVA